MAVVSMNYLLEAGVHFGHQTKRWNPKMKEFIFTARDDIYIIDLQKTLACIEKAYEEIKTIAANNGTFLFVGTKKQAGEASREEAERSKSYYVTERWLGGTLTNFRTIRKRINRLTEIETMEKEGVFEQLPKKEVIGLRKEYEKLNKILCGIREMDKLPQALIVVDPKKEINAIKEARILNIPVFGVVDTNGDPDDVDYIIPGNDDAVRSIKLILGVLNNAICEAKGLELVDYVTEDETKTRRHGEEVSMEKVLKEEKVIDKDQEAFRESRNFKTPRKFERPEHKKEEVEVVAEEVVKTIVEAVPVTEDLSGKTLAELKDLAKNKGIKGISTMKKADLIAALNE